MAISPFSVKSAAHVRSKGKLYSVLVVADALSPRTQEVVGQSDGTMVLDAETILAVSHELHMEKVKEKVRTLMLRTLRLSLVNRQRP